MQALLQVSKAPYSITTNSFLIKCSVGIEMTLEGKHRYFKLVQLETALYSKVAFT